MEPEVISDRLRMRPSFCNPKDQPTTGGISMAKPNSGPRRQRSTTIKRPKSMPASKAPRSGNGGRGKREFERIVAVSG